MILLITSQENTPILLKSLCTVRSWWKIN